MSADKLFEFLCDATYIPKKHENGESLTEEEKKWRNYREKLLEWLQPVTTIGGTILRIQS